MYTREETLQLVQEYVKHKALMITCCKKVQRDLRNAALCEVSKKVNLPCFGPKDAHRKLRNIKSTYAQEIKKIRTKAARGCKYTSNLKWFGTWESALKKYRAELNHNHKNPQERDVSKESHADEESIDIIKHEFFENEDSLNKSGMIQENDDPHPKSSLTENKGAQDNENCVTAPTVSDINMYDNDDLSEGPAHKNEFDVFGESIGAQLKNMPLKDALEAQMFMQNYLSSFRLESLRRRQTS